MTDDDELFRTDLRRAVATADVDDAWGTIARRVRVQRAGRTTARIGIPVVTAAILVGGLVTLTNRKGGNDRPAEQPTTSVAVDTSASTTSTPSAPSTVAATTATTVVAGPDTSAAEPDASSQLAPVAEVLGPLPGSTATPVLGQPDTWTRIGRTTSNGLSYDVAAFDLPTSPVQRCLSIRFPDAARSLADACPQPDHVTSVVVQGGMFVFLVRTDPAPVTVRTSTRTYTVAGLAVGTDTAFVTVLPPPVELVQMADGPDLTACPPHEVWTALDATGAFDGGLPSLSILRCAPSGAMVIGSESTSRILQPGGGVARRTASGIEIYGFGGTFCDMAGYTTETPELQAKRDGAEAVCREFGLLSTPSS